ncbi:MAG: hypothetical protein M1812_005291 [Candelaria pacifica]|nr:MAG: hypothetical protein M1812_005291 [Candelaria pacifica]
MSKIEGLPSELLEMVTDYLVEPADIKAWRQCSKRLSAFGGLYETMHVYTTRASLEALSSVSHHPDLSKEVRTVVCWLPLFYSCLTRKDTYISEAHEKQAEIIVKRDEAALSVEEVEMNKDINVQYCWFTKIYNEALERTSDEDLQQGFDNYSNYYKEQKTILQNELVSTLSAALKLFPKLRTVIEYPSPTLRKEIILTPGIRTFRFNRAYPLGRADLPHQDFMHKVIQAIAESEVSLRTFAIDTWIWSTGRTGKLPVRTLPISSAEEENMVKVFRPLRNLMLGLKDPSDRDDDEYEVDSDYQDDSESEDSEQEDLELEDSELEDLESSALDNLELYEYQVDSEYQEDSESEDSEQEDSDQDNSEFDPIRSNLDQVTTVLGSAPLLEDLCLSVSTLSEYAKIDEDSTQSPSPQTPFANLVWPRLKTLVLHEVTITSNDLLAFLRNHCNKLESIEFHSVHLKDGPWKPIFNLLREHRTSLQHVLFLCIRITWDPYIDYLKDESEAVENYIRGSRDWDGRLEQVYGRGELDVSR